MKVVQSAGNCPPYTPHNIQKEVDQLSIFIVHCSGMRIGLDWDEKVYFHDFEGQKFWKSKSVKMIRIAGKYHLDDPNNLQKELGQTRGVHADAEESKS